MAAGHGGRRAGAGRKKGSRSKSTVALLEAAAANRLTPLEFLLQNMARHIKAKRWAEAERSAIAACPYVHAKLQATTLSGQLSLTSMTDDQLRNFIAEGRAQLGRAPNGSAGNSGAAPGAKGH